MQALLYDVLEDRRIRSKRELKHIFFNVAEVGA